MIGGTKERIVGAVMKEALRTLNMPAAIEKHGALLDQKERDQLLSITTFDLRTLVSVQNKLGPLGSFLHFHWA